MEWYPQQASRWKQILLAILEASVPMDDQRSYQISSKKKAQVLVQALHLSQRPLHIPPMQVSWHLPPTTVQVSWALTP
jgi:hypothetical protein